MAQAIVTTYLGPTNSRGSRIKATADSGSVTIPYDHGASDPYALAAYALIAKMGWQDYGDIVGGWLPKGKGKVWVFLAG